MTEFDPMKVAEGIDENPLSVIIWELVCLSRSVRVTGKEDRVLGEVVEPSN